MGIISRSNSCPNCGGEHSNSCFITYSDGYKCFSCGYSKSVNPDYYCYKNKNPSNIIARSWDLTDFTFDTDKFSNYCKKWLLRYFVDDELIKKHHIMYGYIPECLLYPVLIQNDTLIEYQKRFFPKKGFYSSLGLKKSIFCIRESRTVNSNTLYLVEDYLSCIRLGEFADTMCLFGTSLNKTYINYIIRNYSNIRIWMDADEPGKNASKKIKKQLIKAFENNMHMYPHLYQNNILIEETIQSFSPKEVSNTILQQIIKE